ncbi:hypothetical protein KSD_63480 [Ktedonobacter sp. SOSP1-85]|uniref:glucosamine-6-phosphate deaminase n=1 Tax=Ktedonobacter sp. SOSP1-85 TaxID=2778367 RepID=UPI001A3601AA|nr:glucosamine-6-phosphate deaminase [Ktedonobacter sp. SOSP1-85]GHO78577.1 hypothetical protein KSD_63480 [Ktedonobacter sp. SOSP1-85]
MHIVTQKKPEVVIAESDRAIARMGAAEIANLIQMRNAADLPTVLGLATGKTPILLYREFIRIAREKALDFSRVITFNLDEYYPMNTHSPQSYHHFMRANLFDHIDIHPAHIHIPDGTLSRKDIANYCAEYEEKIQQAGGINLQLLGIGENGHIGFNEPGSDVDTRTRLVTLDPITRQNAAAEFGGETNTPSEAITMGIATILEAQRIILIASGSKKAHAVQQAINGPVNANVPATYLRSHSNVTIYLDPAAAKHIKSA